MKIELKGHRVELTTHDQEALDLAAAIVRAVVDRQRHATPVNSNVARAVVLADGKGQDYAGVLRLVIGESS